jgi:subtilisin-like proprotein convertase family protein
LGWVPATVDVSANGSTWINMYQNAKLETVVDSSWQLINYNISAVADNQSTVYVRWGYQIKANANAYSGWNIDDVVLTGTPGGGEGSTFSNTTSITINDESPASPYPSSISVSGLSGTITDVNVTLSGLTHAHTGQVDIMLVGPSGANTLLLSDAGWDNSASSLNLIFDDSASSMAPQSTPLTSTIYKPTNYDATFFFDPAPLPSSTVALSNFNGASPNGTWSLYVLDNDWPGAGSISGGWSLTITTDDETTTVVSLTPTSTGFQVRFSDDLDPGVLNLYDDGGTLGPADLSLVGARVGKVRGSLVIDPGLREATFIATNGLLPMDQYTVTLTSGATAFRDSGGSLLDGDENGTPGGDFIGNFTVLAPADNAVTVSLPNVTRGYGQPVNLPANVLTAGLPLRISNGMGVTRVELAVQYDPALLSISAFTLNAAVASRAAYTLDTTVSGRAVLTITAATGLADVVGQLTVGSFTAQVPNNAPYGAKHVLDITDLRVLDNSSTPVELPAFDDDAVHVAAFFGDANGDGAYNSPDSTLVRRIIGQLNTGLAAYQLADPVLIVDITQNGLIQSNDTTHIRRVTGHVAVPNIPALPTGLPVPPASGADPLVYIPRDLAGVSGGTVTVPVRLQVTERAGITLSGFEVVIEYDSSHLTVTGSQRGGLLSGTDVSGSLTHPAPGRLIYSASALHGTGLLAWGTMGDLFTVTFAIAEGAPAGASVLNLRGGLGSTATAVFDAQLNNLVLSPAPTDSPADGVDGLLMIRALHPAWGFPEVNAKHSSNNDTAVLSPFAPREDVFSRSERRHYSWTSPTLDAPNASPTSSLSLLLASFVPSSVDEIADDLARLRVKSRAGEQQDLLDAVFGQWGQNSCCR